MPFFSVIMPVHNGEKYLERAVDSITKQDFSDFELILVDDGSTDESGKMCDVLASGDYRIKTIHQNNSGALVARRAAVMNAVGLYHIFVDCDDKMQPDALKILFISLNRQPVDLMIYNYYQINKDGKTVRGKKILREDHLYTGKELFLLSIEKFGYLNSLWIKAIRNNISKVAFQKYNLKISMSEDLLISLQLFHLIKNAAYINKFLYEYRCNSGSTMNKIQLSVFSDYEFVYNEEIKLINNPEIQRMLTGKYITQVLADIYFYWFQNHLSYQKFRMLCDDVWHYSYMQDAQNIKINLSIIWKPAYQFFKHRAYEYFYKYLYFLKIGYWIKHKLN